MPLIVNRYLDAVVFKCKLIEEKFERHRHHVGRGRRFPGRRQRGSDQDEEGSRALEDLDHLPT